MSITTQQALDCFASDDLIGIGMEAAAVRRELHPEGVVSYVVQAVVNDERQALQAFDRGASALVLGGVDGIAAYEGMIGRILAVRPTACVEGLSAEGVLALAGATGLPVAEVLGRLQAAGMRCLGGGITGGFAGWLEVHRAAHEAGLKSQATLVFGAGESNAERVTRLEGIRSLQAKTGGFTSFTAVAAPAANGRELDEATAVEYLKTLAISRMVLDNIANIEADLKGQGLKVLQMALRFGANDAGAVSAGEAGREEEVRRLIRDAGFAPVERDMLFTACLLG